MSGGTTHRENRYMHWGYSDTQHYFDVYYWEVITRIAQCKENRGLLYNIVVLWWQERHQW